MSRPARTAGLDRAVEIENTAWRLWQTAAGQLTLAGRATVGDGAAAWARQQLELWVETLTLDEMAEMADELVAEAARLQPVTVAA